MAQSSLSDYKSIINNLLVSQETLLQYHFKADAMLHVMLTDDFFSCPTRVLYDYVWALSDIVNSAKNLNEQLVNFLLRTEGLLITPSSSAIH